MNDQIKDQQKTPPDIVIFHGDDRMLIKTKIKALTSINYGSFTNLNTIRLDGETLKLSAVTSQINTLPLGGNKRIVIIEKADDFIGKQDVKDWLQDLLNKFPPTTTLVLILHDEKKYRQGEMVWVSFGSRHWLRKTIKQFSGSVQWLEFPLPTDREMSGWILNEAENLGGSFHPNAAVILSEMIGNDLYQAKHEIEKAISYVGDGNQVSAKDILLLCAASKDENIFSFVDAIGQRKGQLALKLLMDLRTEMPIQYIFSMVVRQIRMLILAKESLAAGGHEKEVMSACNVKYTFIARKLISQSRQFKMNTLQEIYRALDRIDEDSKTGHVTLEAAFEGLVAQINV